MDQENQRTKKQQLSNKITLLVKYCLALIIGSIVAIIGYAVYEVFDERLANFGYFAICFLLVILILQQANLLSLIAEEEESS